MRHILAGLCALGISACASTGPAPSASMGPQSVASARADSLPPQELADGECGLFLFGMGEGHPFVVFENVTAGRALVVHEGVIHAPDISDQPGVFVPGERFMRAYSAPGASLAFTLTGRVGEETGSGPRLDEALLRIRSADGAETVRPLGGVYSCRRGASASGAGRG